MLLDSTDGNWDSTMYIRICMYLCMCHVCSTELAMLLFIWLFVNWLLLVWCFFWCWFVYYIAMNIQLSSSKYILFKILFIWDKKYLHHIYLKIDKKWQNKEARFNQLGTKDLRLRQSVCHSIIEADLNFLHNISHFIISWCTFFILLFIYRFEVFYLQLY